MGSLHDQTQWGCCCLQCLTPPSHCQTPHLQCLSHPAGCPCHQLLLHCQTCCCQSFHHLNCHCCLRLCHWSLPHPHHQTRCHLQMLSCHHCPHQGQRQRGILAGSPEKRGWMQSWINTCSFPFCLLESWSGYRMVNTLES